MIGFLLKKFFFDLWDNLFKIALINLFFIALLALAFFSFGMLRDSGLLRNAASVFFIFLCSIYLSGAAAGVKNISDYKPLDLTSFLRSFTVFKTDMPQNGERGECVCGKHILIRGLAGAAALCIFAIVLLFILPFYILTGSFPGLLIAAPLFWALIIALLSFQFFFSAGRRPDKKLFKDIKKCFIIFFDNPLFCCFCFLFSCFLLALPTAFLAPGPAGVLLFLDEALRLRLLKYDYLEKTGVRGGRLTRIPWEELLETERKKAGERTFKSLIFPWKD
jgi:hypothetical protein